MISDTYRANYVAQASDSPDGRSGCFIPRDPSRIQGCTFTCQNQYSEACGNSSLPSSSEDVRETDNPPYADITIYPTFGHWTTAIKGPLGARGWTLQERELSPPLLHFTRDLVLWECRECFASEDELDMRLKSDPRYSVPATLSSWPFLDPVLIPWTTKKMLLRRNEWYDMVEAYSRRSLSVPTDKLPAISGIVAQISKRRPNDVYLAGLWKEDIVQGLSWYPDPSVDRPSLVKSTAWPPPAADAGIASWSWAAFNGPIMFSHDKWLKPWAAVPDETGPGCKWVDVPLAISVIDAHITHSSLDQFGRVSGGQVLVFGWGIGVSVSEAHLDSGGYSATGVFWPPFKFRRKTSKRYRLSEPCSAVLYFDVDMDKLQRLDVVCMQMWGGSGLHSLDCIVIGLVLVRVKGDQPNSYRRVGVFDASKDVDNRNHRDEEWMRVRQEMTLCIL